MMMHVADLATASATRGTARLLPAGRDLSGTGVAAFRGGSSKRYLGRTPARDWPEGMLDKIKAL